jgi:hypothetical protein
MRNDYISLINQLLEHSTSSSGDEAIALFYELEAPLQRLQAAASILPYLILPPPPKHTISFRSI